MKDRVFLPLNSSTLILKQVDWEEEEERKKKAEEEKVA